MTFPPCFNSQAEFDAWEAALKSCVIEKNHPPPTYCSDCLPHYKERMIAEGRCTHPTVRFTKNGPAAFVGRRIYIGKKETGQ